MLTIQEQANLLEKYKELKSHIKMPEQKRIQNFTELIGKFKQFHVDNENIARNYAYEFNIFEVLRVSTDEVRHSAFLLELLDPQGAHGQGILFLRTFLEKCAERSSGIDIYNQILNVIDEGKWTVMRERSTNNFGRMDVVIMNPIIGIVVVIENKIYAHEQVDQLKNYGNWMKSLEKDYPYRGLILLSPSGYQSMSAGGYQCLQLSYRRDITDWLFKVLSQTQAPVVRSTIEQYLNITTML